MSWDQAFVLPTCRVEIPISARQAVLISSLHPVYDRPYKITARFSLACMKEDFL